MFVANVVLYFVAPSVQSASNWGILGTVGDMLVFVSFLAFPIVGALIASKHPRNPVGWICLADGLLWMLIDTFEYYSTYGVTQRGSVPFPDAIAALNNWLWVPTVGLVGTYLLLLFPDGKLPSKRWLPLAWLSGAVIVLLSITGFWPLDRCRTLKKYATRSGSRRSHGCRMRCISFSRCYPCAC
jgi:hypothetical protein